MEKRLGPVLFDDSGRHVDMTEIIEHLYIGNQWVLKPHIHLVFQGSCQEHLLPEEGGSDARAEHRGGAAERHRGHQREVLQVGVGQLIQLSRPFGIKYKGLKLLDVPQANIALHFNEVVEFIEEGLEGGGEKFLLS